MKFKTTRKAITNNYPNIVSVGYCDLYHLLSVTEPIAYTCGVYGWNFDLYVIDDLAICTGYRNMPGRTAKNVRSYELEARKILAWDNPMPYEEKRDKVRQLLHEFAEQA